MVVCGDGLAGTGYKVICFVAVANEYVLVANAGQDVLPKPFDFTAVNTLGFLFLWRAVLLVPVGLVLWEYCLAFAAAMVKAEDNLICLEPLLQIQQLGEEPKGTPGRLPLVGKVRESITCSVAQEVAVNY